jgi:hypothetical protein
VVDVVAGSCVMRVPCCAVAVRAYLKARFRCWVLCCAVVLNG